MKIKEKWKQPVSRSTIWITLALVVFLICGIIGFSQIVNHSRFERPAWAVMLSVVWFSAIVQFMKPGRRMRQRYPVLFLVGYTLFAEGISFRNGRPLSSICCNRGCNATLLLS